MAGPRPAGDDRRRTATTSSTGLRAGRRIASASATRTGEWASEWYEDTVYDRATEVPVDGGLTTPVDASLAPAGHIAGVVRDTEGNPIPGIEVSRLPLHG